MTVRQEQRFVCDRCKAEATMPVLNVPITDRMAPAPGWLVMRLGAGADIPPQHLCAACAKRFDEFMKLR